MRNLPLPARHLTPVALLSLALGACSSMASGPDPAVQDNGSGANAPAPGQKGVIVPGEHAAISLWPEAYSGELLVLEVRPEGTPVVEGDVLAQLDTQPIEEQIASASLEFESARIAHEGLLEKNSIAREIAVADLARAQTSLARARHTLDGYENHELGLMERADGISKQREQYRVDDQNDELDQLEAMYTADELTDATEEIVLKRSRRGLQLTLDSNALSVERRQYRDDFSRRNELESRREALAKETQALEHLQRKQASEQAARDDAERRSTASGSKKEERVQRLTRDLELFTIRAPRAGVLLHGKLADFRPGKSHARLERASKLATRANVLMVVEPGKLAVALDLSESAVTALADGTAVRVRPLHGSNRDCTGQLTVSPYPTKHKGSEGIFTGNITLDGATPGWVIGTQVSVEAAAATQ